MRLLLFGDQYVYMKNSTMFESYINESKVVSLQGMGLI